MKTRIIKARELLRPRSKGRKETRYVQITMSGNWLSEMGFKAGESFYITEHDGGLLLSPTPANVEVQAFGTLEQLKERFAELNIPTERRKKS